MSAICTNPLIRSEHAHAHAASSSSNTAVTPDEVLIAAIRAGDRSAEEQLYRRHAGAVLNLAARLLHSREDAMDVLQDAFVTAFEKLNELRDPTAFRPWLLRVAVRLVHRRFRKKKLLGLLGLVSRRGDGEGVSLDALADPTVSPEARAELRWLDRKLTTASDHERAAWLLRHVDGFALEEVADACDCSLATAKRRIAAADAIVRAHFGNEMTATAMVKGGVA